MARPVDEWVGKTDDAAIPPRVKDRIVLAAGKQCQECRKPFSERNKPQFDHIISLINSGRNAETNLQALCGPCHGVKTKVDVAEKSDMYRSRAKSMGYFAPKQSIKSPGFPNTRPQHSAQRKPTKRVGMFSDG